MASLDDVLGKSSGVDPLLSAPYNPSSGGGGSPLSSALSWLGKGITYTGVKLPMTIAGTVLGTPQKVAYRAISPVVRELGQGLEQLTAGVYTPSRKAVAADKAAGVSGFRIGDLFSNEQKAGGDLFKDSLARRDTMLPKGLLKFGFEAAVDPLNFIGVGETSNAVKGLKQAERLSGRETVFKLAEIARNETDAASKKIIAEAAARVVKEGKGAIGREARDILAEKGLAADPTLVFGLGKKAIAIPGTQRLAESANELLRFGGARAAIGEKLIERAGVERKTFGNMIPPVGRELRAAADATLKGETSALLSAIPSITYRRWGVGETSNIMNAVKDMTLHGVDIDKTGLQAAQRAARKSADHGVGEVMRAIVDGEADTPLQKLTHSMLAAARSGEQLGHELRITPYKGAAEMSLEDATKARLSALLEDLSKSSVLKQKVNKSTALDVLSSVLDDATKLTVTREVTAPALADELLNQGLKNSRLFDNRLIKSEARSSIEHLMPLAEAAAKAEEQGVTATTATKGLTLAQRRARLLMATEGQAKQVKQVFEAMDSPGGVLGNLKAQISMKAAIAEDLGVDAVVARQRAKDVLKSVTVDQLPKLPQLSDSNFLMETIRPSMDALVPKMTKLAEQSSALEQSLTDFAKSWDSISSTSTSLASKVDVTKTTAQAVSDIRVSLVRTAEQVDALKSAIAERFGSVADALSDAALEHGQGAELLAAQYNAEASMWGQMIQLKEIEAARARLVYQTALGRAGITFDKAVETEAARLAAIARKEGAGKLNAKIADDLEAMIADKLHSIATGSDIFGGLDADEGLVRAMFSLDNTKWLDIGGDKWLHASLNDFLSRTRTVEGDVTRFLADYNSVTKLWRAQILAMPGFSNRNWIGGFLQNWQDGVKLRHYGDMATVYKEWVHNGGTMTDKAAALLRKYNMSESDGEALITEIGHTLGRGIGETAEFEPNRLLWRLEQIQEKMDSKNPFTAKWLATMGKAHGVPVEMNLRMAHVAAQMEQNGGLYRMAVDRMYYLHVDYTDLSEFDVAAKRFYPFWMYRTRNLVRQAHLLSTSNALGRTLQLTALRQQAEAMNENDTGMPPFLGPSTIPMLGGQRFLGLGGVSGPADFFDQTLGVTSSAIEGDWPQVFRTIFAPDGLDPKFQLPIELGTNTDLFSGRPITKAGESKWGATLQYLLNQVPVYSTVDRGINSPSLPSLLTRALNVAGVPVWRQYQNNS